ncbi:glycosyltransferase family 8 protein [Enterococcus gilvus]|uniref:glycosyltransferase family 8 protein n=1 Tax=Enterococcus gilvus TaxID=160453 RepID=UPI001C8CA6B9|nr:glycosyltransferase family 8 protein [Enterococcus gilvus]MBX8936865.1 glycosyltransferase family 8 protein [Enterococcus gilvus]
MIKEKMTVVSSCNDAFAAHVTALFVSILENIKGSKAALEFYVIDDEISLVNKRLMRTSIKGYGAALHFLTIDKHYFDCAVESDRIPETAYYRIAIPELLKNKDIDRVLYLDCDMIAVEDISELWNIDLTDYTVAAIEDAGFHQRLEKMEIACDSTKYFNSGFMLINVKKWLNENVTKRVLRFIEDNPEKLRFHDQDALNAILHDQWLPLHPKWNAQSYIMNREVKHPDPTGEREYSETRKAPKIIHYSGHIKPWSDEFTSPLKRYYEEYERLTAFSADYECEKKETVLQTTKRYG